MTPGSGASGLLAKAPVRLAVAVAAVALGNVLLFSIVRMEPPEQKVRHRTWPKVYLFPMDEPPATSVQENLLGWMDLLDPTVLSLPSERRGFSRVRKGEFVRPLMAPQAWELTVAQADLPTVKEVPLTAADENVLGQAAALAATAPPDLPPRARYRPPQMEPGVYWTGASGELLAEPPAIQLAEMPQGISVVGPTRLRAVVGKTHIRATVTESCGDRRLDLKSLEAMQKWLGPDPKRLPKEAQVSGGIVALSVQWRWLPGITLKQPALDRSIWNGEDWRAFNWR